MKEYQEGRILLQGKNITTIYNEEVCFPNPMREELVAPHGENSEASQTFDYTILHNIGVDRMDTPQSTNYIGSSTINLHLTFMVVLHSIYMGVRNQVLA